MEELERRAKSGVLIDDVADIQSRASVDVTKFADNVSVVKNIVMVWAIRVSFEYLCYTESGLGLYIVVVKL